MLPLPVQVTPGTDELDATGYNLAPVAEAMLPHP